MEPQLPTQTALSPSSKATAILSIYLIIMLAIPVGFAVYKRTQEKGRFNPIASANPQTEAKAGDSSSSALDELKQSLENITPTPTQDSQPASTSFGPNLDFSIEQEGRPANKQAGKVFIGIGSGGPQVKPTFLVSFTVDVPQSGKFSGVSLAGLDIGSTYTAYIKGPAHIDKAIPFIVKNSQNQLNSLAPIPLLSGDLNEDNLIDDKDLTIIKGLLGTNPSSNGWNEAADFNGDLTINSLDVSYVLKNKGKTGDSGAWFSVLRGAALGISIEATASGAYIIHLPKFSPPNPDLNSDTSIN